MKVKVDKVNIGIYEYDSIVVKMDNTVTQICFDKSENVQQYEGKDINLILEDGEYKIDKGIKTTK